jgi:hypothetical protein
MRRWLLLLPAALFLSFALCPAPAASEDGWEITPFAGLHFGGSFEDNAAGAGLDVDEGAAFGFILGAPDEVDTRYEFYYSFQRTDLSGGGTFGGGPLFDMDIHYFHLGGSYRFLEGKVRPFVAGGLGATHFAPRGDGPGSKTYFSVSLGGGAFVPVSDSVALRVEGRGFLTILPESSTIFCVSSGGASCVVDVQGDVFGQFLLTAGIAFSL